VRQEVVHVEIVTIHGYKLNKGMESCVCMVTDKFDLRGLIDTKEIMRSAIFNEDMIF